MSIYTFFEGMLIGLFLFISIFSLFLALKNIDRKINISFFIFELFISIVLIVSLMNTYNNNPLVMVEYDRYINLAIFIAGIAFIHMISYLTQYNSKIWRIGLSAILIIFIILNFVMPYNITWDEIYSIKKMTMFWGDSFNMLDGKPNPLIWLLIVFLGMLLLYIIISLRYQIKYGDKKYAKRLFLTIAIGIFGLILDQILTIFEIRPIVIIDDLSYLAFAILIGQKNFSSVLKSSMIKDELSKSDARLKLLSQATFEGIVIIEGNEIIDVNSQFSTMMGYAKEEIIGNPISHFIDFNSEQSLMPGNRNATSIDEYKEFTAIKKNGGTFPVELRDRKIQVKDNLYTVFAVRNIQARKKMETLLVQSEKMISIAGLAAGMAHEINNPLGTIVQGCQNLTRRSSEKIEKNIEILDEIGISIEQLQEYFERRQIPKIISSMQNAASKAAEIIKNMLQFSRTSETEKELHNISEVIRSVMDLAYSDYDMKKKYDLRSIKIIKNIHNDLPILKINITEIQQVLLNLIRNAVQALRSEKASNKLPLIKINAYFQDNFLYIEIEDNGPGISDEDKKRIFEPFFTTKEIGEGTGLGLSVSYMIIKTNHRGDIYFESEEGKGTTFIIKLPI